MRRTQIRHKVCTNQLLSSDLHSQYIRTHLAALQNSGVVFVVVVDNVVTFDRLIELCIRLACGDIAVENHITPFLYNVSSRIRHDINFVLNGVVANSNTCWLANGFAVV